MHTELKKIQSLESAPKVVKNLFSAEEIGQFLKLYEELPIAVNNLKQKVIKKRWLDGFGKDLELLYKSRIKSIIGDFKMDNLITEDGKECFGLFQESYKPLKLHVDAGFNLEDLMHNAPDIIDYKNDSMKDVMTKFQNSNAWNLPVVKDHKYIGFVSKSKLLTAYRRQLINFTKS